VFTFAIGDVHGCLDLLQALLLRIEAYADGRAYKLVFLGDYIDRGPDSAGVIQTVRDLQAKAPGEVIALKGNHEALMLDAVAHPDQEDLVDLWLFNGGDAALQSFGISDVSGVPDDVIAWARQLPVSYEDGLRYFVHAGVDPRRTLHEQEEHTQLWIRRRFHESDHDFGKHIVHGHTPTDTGRPDERSNRTNLDTGAVRGGALTAGVFTKDQAKAVTYLQVRAGDPAE
jgi:serine/threonine protein phosphatase 1